MIARTRRWNLAEKVEAFFRRNPNEDEAEKLSPHELLKQQLLLFKESLQSKLKETGLVQDAEVHIQILDTGSKEAGATITGIAAAFSEGLSREDSSQIERMMKAVMEEQQTIKAEKIRVRSLQKGYLFGADENEVRTHEEDDEEETNELKEAIIPLLKQNFL
ncbi:hypothetical protein AB6A40_006358 [Gnathostoma spinigerum]|uniref:Uncharacterized protein n=1 Tax=Gnathostoma spinigerum TaxID=75299 RepID=A0ABD6EI54_9BILA